MNAQNLKLALSCSGVDLFAAGLRGLVPEARLYPAVLRLSGWVAAPGHRFRFRERVVRALLTALTQQGATFTPAVRTDNFSLVEQAYGAHRRLLLCSGHLPLNRMLHRLLIERSYRHAVIHGVDAHWDYIDSRYRDGWVWGARGSFQFLPRSPQVLLRARRALREGRIVVLNVDLDVQRGPAIPIATPLGTRYVHRGIFALARHTRTPVLFYATHLNSNGSIAVCFEKPTHWLPASEEDAVRCAEECAAFLSCQFNEDVDSFERESSP